MSDIVYSHNNHLWVLGGIKRKVLIMGMVSGDAQMYLALILTSY